MKLTDEQIDTLFKESAAKQAFAYKPEYWEEFSASLPDITPLSEASDAELDAAFQQSAAQQSFDYKPEYWDAFAAGLATKTPLSQASDADFDAVFQERAADISVDYKPEFWNEFSDSLSSIASTENTTDIEVDALYREEVANLSFAYQPSYWEEMAAMLRRRRRRPEFLWFGLSGIFAATLITMLFMERSPLKVTWDAPEFNVGNMPPETNGSRTSTLAFNSHNSSAEHNTVQASVTEESTVLHSENQTSDRIANTTNGNNSTSKRSEINSHVATNHTPNNSHQNTANITRTKPVAPKLPLTPQTLSPEMRLTADNQENVTEADALEPRTLESSELPYDNALAMTNLRNYKGGLRSGFYVQGVAGISESLLANSDALSTSYGLGFGWQIHHRNWTFNAGSNLIVNNYSDIKFENDAVRHQQFGGGLLHSKWEISQVITAELDLGLGYNVGRHQFRLGLRPSYDVRSYYTQKDVFNRTDGNTEADAIVVSTFKSFDTELDQFQRLGLKPSLGYAYNFRSGWIVGMAVGTELMTSISATSNTPGFNYFERIGENNTLPIDGQLYIRKTLNYRR